MIYNDITELIGKTPLLKVPASVHKLSNIDLYIKLELFNPWGSVKDRTALGMARQHMQEIENGKKLLELSSGNTAKALQLIASTHGSSFKAITNRIKVSEQRDILRLLGAEIEELPGKSDCYDPNDPNDPMIIINRELQSHPDEYIFTNQYVNRSNRDIHFETTGEEIAQELEKVDHFIAGLGTTGSSRGIVERLEKDNPDIKSVGVVAKANDYIPGIRTKDEVLEVGLFDPKNYEDILTYSSRAAIDGMLILAQKLGVLAGPTSGATFMGALDYLGEVDKKISSRQTAVFIACDRLEWYLSYVKERRPELFGGKERRTWHDQPVASDVRPTISISEAEAFIKKEQPIIVDTRNPLAYKMGHIEGSVNFPYDQLDSVLNEAAPFTKDKPLLFVCAVGEKSLGIARYLRGLGYQAYSLDEGITAWRDAELPLNRKPLR